MIVFDSGFKNLKNVMDTLGVATLTNSDNKKEFMIVIICSTSVAKCLGTADTKTAVYKAQIVMVFIKTTLGTILFPLPPQAQPSRPLSTTPIDPSAQPALSSR